MSHIESALRVVIWLAHAQAQARTHTHTHISAAKWVSGKLSLTFANKAQPFNHLHAHICTHTNTLTKEDYMRLHLLGLFAYIRYFDWINVFIFNGQINWNGKCSIRREQNKNDWIKKRISLFQFEWKNWWRFPLISGIICQRRHHCFTVELKIFIRFQWKLLLWMKKKQQQKPTKNPNKAN